MQQDMVLNSNLAIAELFFIAGHKYSVFCNVPRFPFPFSCSCLFHVPEMQIWSQIGRFNCENRHLLSTRKLETGNRKPYICFG
jgi:hypothetical protein